MKLKCVFAVIALLAATPHSEAGQKKEASKAGLHAKMLGAWSYASGVRAGEKVGSERLVGEVTIAKDTVTLPAGPDDKFVMAYKIDATKTPATIDLTIKSGPVPEGAAKGIIKMEADKLTLCYDPTGAKRPGKFESTADNGAFLFVLKRTASIDAARLKGEWTYASGNRAGEKVAQERLIGTVAISKETITLPAGPDDKFVMAYKIDATKTPATIDLKIKSGPVPEGATKGIIKLQGDQITLCYHPEGEKRPKKFKATADNGFFLFVLKRKQ